MIHSRIQGSVSFWFAVWMLFALTLLGCHSVQLQHAVANEAQPYLPRATEERFKECAALINKDTERGSHSVDARVQLDGYGRVFDATTRGEPNPDVGMCIRVALRDMQVDKEVIEGAALRSKESSSQAAQKTPNGAYVGQVAETVTVVTVVFVEIVIIDEVLIPLAITVTASIAAGAIHDAMPAKTTPGRKSRDVRKPHQPVPKKWLDNGGSIDSKADGTTTYTRSDGVAVTYNKEGFPDFTPYRHPTVKDVQIEFTGNYEKDNSAADKAAGITRKKRDAEEYVWHHHQDGKTMQLIKKDVHEDFFHTGGMAGARSR